MNLTGQLLIAMPAMTDPVFSKTVTLICTHNQDGVIGVVLNRPMQLSVTSLFSQIQLAEPPTEYLQALVHFGGPVQGDRGFVLHSTGTEYNSTIIVNPHIALTTSKDILEAMAQNQAPQKVLIALGYAGWTAGQLEAEMAQNAWLSVQTNLDSTNLNFTDLVFDMPHTEKFERAMAMMGLNYANLEDTAGHA